MLALLVANGSTHINIFRKGLAPRCSFQQGDIGEKTYQYCADGEQYRCGYALLVPPPLNFGKARVYRSAYVNGPQPVEEGTQPA